MRTKFGDKSIIIHFIQQFLSENYNPNIIIDGEYYEQYNMNYGFAHFIAKYLNYKYPLLDRLSIEDYDTLVNNPSQIDVVRDLTKPISIMNYFLCDNSGNRLEYSNDDEKMYRKIYNTYMSLVPKEGFPNTYEPIKKRYFVFNDMPLFTYVDKSTDPYTYTIKNNIFKLKHFGFEKEICEIDDLVGSYLLGRTISPHSSMEDIYYAQKLLIHDRAITKEEKGIWCVPGQEGTIYDFTQTVIKYQKERVVPQSKNKIFVTGYFDIYTEAYALKEYQHIGGDNNGTIYGL